jgi:hypothetical protein
VPLGATPFTCSHPRVCRQIKGRGVLHIKQMYCQSAHLFNLVRLELRQHCVALDLLHDASINVILVKLPAAQNTAAPRILINIRSMLQSARYLAILGSMLCCTVCHNRQAHAQQQFFYNYDNTPCDKFHALLKREWEAGAIKRHTQKPHLIQPQSPPHLRLSKNSSSMSIFLLASQ